MTAYVVAGATGHTGSAVAQALLDQQRKVRVLVRGESAKGERWRKRGADVSVTDLGNAHDLAAALRGAEAAFLFLPRLPPATTGVRGRAKRVIDAMVQAIGGSALKHVVFLSSQGAQHADGTGTIVSLHDAEQELRPLKTPMTFLRSTYFVENWGETLADAREGLLNTFFPEDFRHPHVSAHEVGRIAAELLVDHPKAHRVVELAGPEEVSAADVAAILGRLFGTEVEPIVEPLGEMAHALESTGFSPEMAGLVQTTHQAILEGRVAWEHPETVRRGKETVEQTLSAMLAKL